MKKFYEKFLKIHRSYSSLGNNVSSNLREEIKRSFKERDIVEIFDSNPWNLSLVFLFLIDLEICPILLTGADLDSTYNKIINGKIYFGNSKTSQFERSYICLTSGTMGKRKEISLNVDNGIQNAIAHGLSINVQYYKQINQVLPIYHSFGIICYIFTSLAFEIPISFKRFDKLTKKDLDKSVMHLTPNHFLYIDELFKKNSSKNLITFGGSPVDTDALVSLQENFLTTDIAVTYGFTEAGPRVSTGFIKNIFDVKERKSRFWIGQPLNQISMHTSEKQTTIITPFRANQFESDAIICPDILQNSAEGWYFLKRKARVLKLNGQFVDIAAATRFVKSELRDEQILISLRPQINGVGADYLLATVLIKDSFRKNEYLMFCKVIIKVFFIQKGALMKKMRNTLKI